MTKQSPSPQHHSPEAFRCCPCMIQSAGPWASAGASVSSAPARAAAEGRIDVSIFSDSTRRPLLPIIALSKNVVTLRSSQVSPVATINPARRYNRALRSLGRVFNVALQGQVVAPLDYRRGGEKEKRSSHRGKHCCIHPCSC